MRRTSFVSVATMVAFLSAAVVPPALAQSGTATTSASPLRTSIDRAAERAAQLPTPPARRPNDARKQVAMGGGGGGKGMMVMTLVMTAAGLVGTYYVVKELEKSTEDLPKQ